MKQVELYGRVRYAVKIQGMSRREAARLFGIDRRTVDKMLAFSTPPGYRRKKAPNRPKLDPFVGIIDQILEDDTKRRIPNTRRGSMVVVSITCASPTTKNAPGGRPVRKFRRLSKTSAEFCKTCPAKAMSKNETGQSSLSLW